MKTLHIPLEDAEHTQLLKKKGKLTWKEYLFMKCVVPLRVG